MKKKKFGDNLRVVHKRHPDVGGRYRERVADARQAPLAVPVVVSLSARLLLLLLLLRMRDRPPFFVCATGPPCST